MPTFVQRPNPVLGIHQPRASSSLPQWPIQEEHSFVRISYGRHRSKINIDRLLLPLRKRLRRDSFP